MIVLSKEERQRFADWLEQEVASDELLLDQLQKIAPPLARQRQAEIDASKLIARKLRSIEML